MGAGAVGRKKKLPSERDRKPVALTVRGDRAWREWVEDGARNLRMPVSVVMDHALVMFFRERGYLVSPPERILNSPSDPTSQPIRPDAQGGASDKG